MGAQVMQLLPGGEDFRFVGFKGALAQVGKQCLLDSLLMGGNPALQRIQLLEAEIQGQRLAGFKVLPLPLAQGLQGRKIRLLLLQGGEHLGQFLGGQVPGAGQAHLVQHPCARVGSSVLRRQRHTEVTPQAAQVSSSQRRNASAFFSGDALSSPRPMAWAHRCSPCRASMP